jgi:integrase
MAVLRKRHTGKWQVIIRKKGYPAIVRSFLDKSVASKWAKAIESQMDRRVFEDMSGAEATTLRSLLIKYRDEIIPNYKSCRTLTYKVNNILKFKICYYSLLHLNSAHINEFKKQISVGRANKTINGYISTLSNVWELARKNWGIVLPAQNPFKLVSYLKVQNERTITLTDLEFNKLIEEAEKLVVKNFKGKVIGKVNYLADMIKFAGLTACRYSEITKLTKNDVDFERRTATLIDTKNGETRTIPLPQQAVEILKARRTFGDKFFLIKSREAFRNYWDKCRNNAGLPEFRFHDIRSHAIRKMLKSGMQAIEVAQVSGHKTLNVLYKRYSRITAEDLIDKVSNIVVGKF